MSKKFAIVKGEIVDGIALADAPMSTDGTWIDLDGIEPQPGPGWTYSDGAFSPPPVPVDSRPPVITKLAFRFRLTDAEYVGILQAAKTQIAIAAWLETFNMVSQINLADARTIAGVQQLAALDLLTDERAATILTAPVSEEERP
jgi:hypothetical protein